MKTEGDYLWDRSCEPDPEVQQLEEILGTLRYQPRTLEIPSGVQVGRESSFFRGSVPRLAIAAAITALLFALGLFLGLQRLQRGGRPELVKSGTTAKPNVTFSPQDEKPNSPLAVSQPQPEPQRTAEPPRQNVNRTQVAGSAWRIRNAMRERQLAQEQQRAAAAKEQLMLALRVVSVKFGYAQRKAQSVNQKDQVRNQHKIG